MHFSVLVTVDGSVKEADISTAVDKLLAPFDENIDVPEYAIDPATDKWHDTWEVALPKAKAWHAENSQKALAGSKAHYFDDEEDTTGFTDLQWLNWYSGSSENDGPWVEDGKGGYAEMSTYNPNSKWDWYEIGGRWADYLNQIPNGKETHPVWGSYTVYKDGKNYLRRRDLRRPQTTNSHLSKTGEWFQKPSPDLDNIERGSGDAKAAFAKIDDDWSKTQAEYLLTVPGEDWLVVVDIHI